MNRKFFAYVVVPVIAIITLPLILFLMSGLQTYIIAHLDENAEIRKEITDKNLEKAELLISNKLNIDNSEFFIKNYQGHKIDDYYLVDSDDSWRQEELSSLVEWNGKNYQVIFDTELSKEEGNEKFYEIVGISKMVHKEIIETKREDNSDMSIIFLPIFR